MKKTKLITSSTILGVIAAAVAITPNAEAVVTWGAGAPGGTSGGSAAFDNSGTGNGQLWLDTGVASADLGGDRDGASAPVPTDYTISMWINSNTSGAEAWFLGTGSQGLHLGIRNTTGGTADTLSQGHWGQDSDGTTQILANTWYHTTFTYDTATNTQTIYVNGTAEGSAVRTAPNRATTDIILGARNNGGNGPQWNGRLDDVAFWNTVVSPADIASIAGGASPTTFGAQAYWDFEDDQTGTTAAVAGAGGLGAQTLTNITAVPEPSAMVLLLVGALGLVRRRRA